MLADGAEDAELDAEPPVLLQVGVEECIHLQLTSIPHHRERCHGLEIYRRVDAIKVCPMREQKTRRAHARVQACMVKRRVRNLSMANGSSQFN